MDEVQFYYVDEDGYICWCDEDDERKQYAAVPISQYYGFKKALRVSTDRMKKLQKISKFSNPGFWIIRTGEYLTPGKSYGTYYKTVIRTEYGYDDDFEATKARFGSWWDDHMENASSSNQYKVLSSQGTRNISWTHIFEPTDIWEITVIHTDPLPKFSDYRHEDD